MNNIVKTLQSRSWRTKEMHEKYLNEREEDVRKNPCPLCEAKILKTYKHWNLVENKYPYDGVVEKHDMIQPKRHTTGNDLTDNELDELEKLKNQF